MNSFKSQKHILKAIIFLLLITSASKLFSQDLDFDEIKVVAPYMPTISEAFKILENPSIEDTLSVETEFKYSITPVKIDTQFELEPISPARMRGEPLPKLYKGLAKAGLGTHNTPYAEFFYNTLRSNEYAYGLRAKHISSSGKIEGYEFSQYSDNLINAYGKRFYNDLTLNANAEYKRDMVHYYGFQKDDFSDDNQALDFINSLQGDDIKQHFNIINANINYNTTHLDSTKLHHSAGFYYRALFDRYEATEYKYSFKGHLGNMLPEDPLGFSETQYFDLFVSADLYNYDVFDNAVTNGLLSLEPRLSSKYRDFKFYIGLDVVTQFDKNTYLKFYPQAHVEASLVEDVLIAYGSFSGGMDKHDLYSTSRINPFINTGTDLPLKFRNRTSDLIGGFKGSISSYVAYNFSVSNAEIENYAFFVNDTTTLLNNKFTLVYDDIRRLNFKGEIFTQIGERFRLRLAADYYEFSLFDEIEAWHEPTVVVSVNGRYNIQDKIILSLDAYARNTTYARGFDDSGEVERIELEGFHVDTNIRIEYRYTRMLALFLNFNNVQNQSLERWLNYPTQRFNFLGGVSYSF